MSALTGKRILVGVSGGIAAYKSPDLVRRLIAAGADVQVVMTDSAERLVSATVFQAVSDRPVRNDLWDDEAERAMGHIELARWANAIVIAPATANVLSQIAAGTATGLLTTLCLASEAPLIVAPAMNQAMWRNPATQSNAKTLRERGVQLVGPDVGDQACGDQGPGRMVEPASIVAAVEDHFSASGDVPDAPDTELLAGVRVLVSAGPTREPIDPVRFISNRSSGKMGFAVAAAAVEAGAQVTLVCGPVARETPAGVSRIDVETAAEMHAAAMGVVANTDIYIGTAAISDYTPRAIAEQKIKKSSDTLTLELGRTDDLLKDIAALPDGPFTVGFAAETERMEEHARGKLDNKRLDMIVGNLVGNGLCFDSDENSVVILSPDGGEQVPRMSKQAVARRIVARLAARYHASRNTPTPITRPRASKR